MLKKTITLTNKLGLHARAAAKLVEQASKFSSEVWISKGGKKVNGKSIMGVMMLAALKDNEVEIMVKGPDEEQALKAITQLFEKKFHERE